MLLREYTYFRTHFVIAPLPGGESTEVFLAFDCASLRFVAIKVLREDRLDDGDARSRLKREAQIYDRLRHRNVVSLIEAGEEAGQPFIVQEYLRGKTLKEMLANFPEGLPFVAAIPILSNICEALHVAHGEKIVHRDLRPDSVMIDVGGEARLFDFGTARVDDDLVNTAAGTLLGKIAYASPEQNRGETVDARSDLYSLGAMFFEMITGQRFNPATSLKKAIEHATRPFPDMGSLNPEVPETLVGLTRKLTSPDPAQRYQSAKDLLIDIGKLCMVEDAADLTPLSGDPFFGKLQAARVALSKGRYDETVRLCQALEAKESSFRVRRPGIVYYLLGRAYAKLERPDMSARYFDKAIFANPKNADFALDYAIELLRKGRKAKAWNVVTGCRDAEDNPLIQGLREVLKQWDQAPKSAAPPKAIRTPADRSWIGKLIKAFFGK